MSKKVSVGVLLTAVLLSIALTVSVTMVIAIRYFNSTVSDVTQRQAMFDYVTDVDKIVRYHYYGTIDEEKLRSALGEGYIDGIGDPYAAYLSAEEYREALDTLAGKQTGFGLDVALSDNGRIVITRVHPQSTADKAGIQAGDYGGQRQRCVGIRIFAGEPHAGGCFQGAAECAAGHDRARV